MLQSPLKRALKCVEYPTGKRRAQGQQAAASGDIYLLKLEVIYDIIVEMCYIRDIYIFKGDIECVLG